MHGEVRPDQSLVGVSQSLAPDQSIAFDPKSYHQAELNAEFNSALGYTPRGLHNLSLQDRAALASLGFPYLRLPPRSFGRLMSHAIFWSIITLSAAPLGSSQMSGKLSQLIHACSLALPQCNKFATLVRSGPNFLHGVSHPHHHLCLLLVAP